MRALIATTLFVAGFTLAGAARPQDKDKQDKQPDKQDKQPEGKDPVSDPKIAAVPFIEGGYAVASGERDGRPIPAEELKDAVVRITGGRIVGTNRDRREFLLAKYTLDTSAKSPWAIELRQLLSQEVTTRGLVKKDGPIVTLVYALPGGAAPTEFKTKEKQQLLVLRAFVADPLPPPNKFSNSP